MPFGLTNALGMRAHFCAEKGLLYFARDLSYMRRTEHQHTEHAMNYKTNRADVAVLEMGLAIDNVIAGCTPTMCPMFHVYGGDCVHVAEAESIMSTTGTTPTRT